MRFEDGMITDHFSPFTENGASGVQLDIVTTQLNLSSDYLSSTFISGVQADPVALANIEPGEGDEDKKDASLEKLEEIAQDRDDGDLDGDAEQKVAAPQIFQQKVEIVEEPIEIEAVLQSEEQDNDAFMNYAFEQGIDLIRDFDPDSGDVLNFSNIMGNYDPSQHVIDQFIISREVEGGSIVSVDPSGTADATKAVDMVALENINNIDLHAWLESGNINLF